MKNKLGALLLACLMSCAVFTGCGESSKKSASSKPVEITGKYVPINGISGKHMSKIDDGLIKVSMECTGNDFVTLNLKGGKFRYGVEMYRNEETFYRGNFSVNKYNEINFEYKYFERVSDETIRISADDKTKLTEQEVKKLIDPATSDDECRKLIEKRATESAVKKMADLNETGTYYFTLAPKIMRSDKLTGYNVVPRILYSVQGISINSKEVPVMLKAVDDVLAVDVYGLEMKGSYEPGEKFTMTYNPYSAIINDEYSKYNLMEDADKQSYLKKQKDHFEKDCGEFNKNMPITFSKGKWVWKNSSGETINQGSYQESKLYPGLIGLYFNEDSNEYSRNLETFTPMYLFIDDDNNVYYPGYIIPKTTSEDDDDDYEDD